MKTTMILIAFMMVCCGKDDSGQGSTTVAMQSPSAELSGKDGASGQNGKDGKDGQNGKDGVNGTNGTNATQVDQNNWIDAATGKEWILGASGNQLSATSVCTGTYRLPTLAELSDACFRGLFKVYGVKLGAPSQTVSWASSGGDIITISTCLASTQANGLQAVIVCVQK